MLRGKVEKLINASGKESSFLSKLASTQMLWMLMAVGVAARVHQFFFNRDLWSDEAALSYNIVRRPFWELFQPLDFYQAALGLILVVARRYLLPLMVIRSYLSQGVVDSLEEEVYGSAIRNRWRALCHIS